MWPEKKLSLDLSLTAKMLLTTAIRHAMQSVGC